MIDSDKLLNDSLKEAGRMICIADKLSKEQGLTQAEWSRNSGFDEFGKMISRTFTRGDCKLHVLIQLLVPLGYEIRIVKKNI